MPAELIRYKQEILESGLSQRQWYRQIYLKSPHWKALRRAKFEASGRFCQIQAAGCLLLKKLDVHHLDYRNIYDVTLDDLQIACRSCHKKLHNHECTATKKPKIKSEARARSAFKAQMFLKFTAKATANFDPATSYSFRNAFGIVAQMQGFIFCKPDVVNKFIRFAIASMEKAGNLSLDEKAILLGLKIEKKTSNAPLIE